MKNLLMLIFIVMFLSQCSPSLNFTNLGNNRLYGLHGKLIAKQGTSSELSQILLEASKLMQSAEGCKLYVVSLDKGNPNEVWITEIWDSKEYHDKSSSLPGVRELISKAIPLLEEDPQRGQQMEVIGGLGIN